METKTVKAFEVRIDDEVKGLGKVTGIVHLSRYELDIYTEIRMGGDFCTYRYDNPVVLVKTN